MSFEASNNRIKVTNTAGATVFDTDRRMPHITTVLSGSLTLPARPDGFGDTLGTAYLLGAAPHGETIIFPMVTTPIAGWNGGSMSVPWQNVPFQATGTTIIAAGAYYEQENFWRLVTYFIRTISFAIHNGNVYLIENYCAYWPGTTGGGGNYAYPAQTTVNYKVYLGAIA